MEPAPETDGPNLDTVSVLDKAGHRKYVYPADVRGKWSRLKPLVYWSLIAIFVALPIIQIGGQPAVFIDFPHREFFLFGAIFNAQDFYMAFFILSGIGFGLIVVAALWGRVWCGWGCPQTVFLDGVFRRLERLIEGPASKRKRLADGPWTGEKIAKKGIKHLLYLVISAGIAHGFLAYFLGWGPMGEMVGAGPGEHPTAFAWAFVLTAIIYGNFWWFREQLCIVICPYGRLQSVLQDEDTINVHYDAKRGEPRGKAKDASAGACVDCRRCIAVCPTNIDIRQGHQLECIGCAYCIDACDDIMVKLNRPTGLIRYDSQRGVETGKRRFWRGRVYFYGFMGLFGLIVGTVVISGNDPFEVTIRRERSAPYTIVSGEVINPVRVQLLNKRSGTAHYELAPAEGSAPFLTLPNTSVELDTFKMHVVPLVIRVPASDYSYGMMLGISVTDTASGEVIDVPIKVMGPRGKIASPSPPTPPTPPTTPKGGAQ